MWRRVIGAGLACLLLPGPAGAQDRETPPSGREAPSSGQEAPSGLDTPSGLAAPSGRSALPEREAPLSAFEGLWTVSRDGNCARGTYSWTVEGDELRFRSPAGGLDVERVVARRPNGFTAVTIASPTSPPGTRWDFEILGPDSLRVRNLSAGNTFPLTRCGAAPAAGTRSTLPQGRWGYVPPSAQEGAKLFWAEPGDNHGTVFVICATHGRTMSVTLAAPPLPIGRRVRVTLSAGSTTTTLDAAAAEGPVSNVAATLPSGHPLIAMLRGGGDRIRVRAATGEFAYDLPLAGAADPAARFQAACRPR